MLKRLMLLILVFGGWRTAYTQIDWSIYAGGGITYMEYVFGYEEVPNFTGGPLYQAGTSISSTFTQEGMLGWEAGLMLVRSGYFHVPPLLDEEGGLIGWNYQQKEKLRDWYVQVPVSLSFNVFEGTGFLLGARINARLTNLDTYNEYFRKWLPAWHMGIFTQINTRIRLDVTAFLDMKERYDLNVGRPEEKLREVGATLSIRYKIK